MNIEIFHLIEGAKQADGLAVIIDVFRAFSMECWLYSLGAKEIRPVGSVEETFAWKQKDPDCILVGERHGRRIDGCDLGNSPSSIDPDLIDGRVNAKAIADYIRKKSPDKVSLVCMGKEGLAQAEEDELCAVYLKALLIGEEMPDIDNRLKALRTGGGRHFFDPSLREVFPEKDFWMCIDRDRFDFVLQVRRDRDGLISVPV